VSTNIPRTQETDNTVYCAHPVNIKTGKIDGRFGNDSSIGKTISKLWRSEGHPVNRKTGKRESGGPFHVTHTGPFIEPGVVNNVLGGNNLELLYSGHILCAHTPTAAMNAHYDGSTPDMDEKSLNADGTTAIARVAPTNPTANLGTTLAETFREGVPSLPGIQSWQARTRFLKSLGSEYLNYQFGWAPLKSEINDVVNTARHHRDIMQNYDHNEGNNIYRRFDFSPEIQEWGEDLSPSNATAPLGTTYLNSGAVANPAWRRVSVRTERKRWFEGCFTYGGPSGTDSFRNSLRFGSDADHLFGLDLTPDVLWELTPWSWAVDWFTNSGDVIKNITNFATAGLVMRYGYMMSETINTYSTQYGDALWRHCDSRVPLKTHGQREGSCSAGYKTIRRSRCPANPFGFGVGWEGLSPTQLAITAALGITRLL